MPNSRVGVFYTSAENNNNNSSGSFPSESQRSTAALAAISQERWVGSQVHAESSLMNGNGGANFPRSGAFVQELMIGFGEPPPGPQLAEWTVGLLSSLKELQSLLIVFSSVTSESDSAAFIAPVARHCRSRDIPLTIFGTSQESRANAEDFIAGLDSKWTDKCSKRQRLHQSFVKLMRSIGSAGFSTQRVPGLDKYEFSPALIVQDTDTQPGYLLWSSQWCPMPETEGKKNANTEWKVANNFGPNAPEPLDKKRVLDLLNRMGGDSSLPATQELRALYKLRQCEAVLEDILSEFHGEAAEELFYCCLPNNHTRQLCGFFTRGMRKLDRSVRDVLIRHPEILYNYGGPGEESEPIFVDASTPTTAVQSPPHHQAYVQASEHQQQVLRQANQALAVENASLKKCLEAQHAHIAELEAQLELIKLQAERPNLLVLNNTTHRFLPPSDTWAVHPIAEPQPTRGGLEYLIDDDTSLEAMLDPQPDVMAQMGWATQVDSSTLFSGEEDEYLFEQLPQPEW